MSREALAQDEPILVQNNEMTVQLSAWNGSSWGKPWDWLQLRIVNPETGESVLQDYAPLPACDEDLVQIDRAALSRIRTSMALLQQNSEGCAANHYGGDHERFGMPGWLTDTKADLDVLTTALASSQQGETK